MQDPSWQDVFAHVLIKLGHHHAPLTWEWLLMPLAGIAWLVIGLLSQRHARHQRVAIVTAIFQRWCQGLDKPLDRCDVARFFGRIERDADRDRRLSAP